LTRSCQLLEAVGGAHTDSPAQLPWSSEEAAPCSAPIPALVVASDTVRAQLASFAFQPPRSVTAVAGVPVRPFARHSPAHPAGSSWARNSCPRSGAAAHGPPTARTTACPNVRCRCARLDDLVARPSTGSPLRRELVHSRIAQRACAVRRALPGCRSSSRCRAGAAACGGRRSVRSQIVGMRCAVDGCRPSLADFLTTTGRMAEQVHERQSCARDLDVAWAFLLLIVRRSGSFHILRARCFHADSKRRLFRRGRSAAGCLIGGAAVAQPDRCRWRALQCRRAGAFGFGAKGLVTVRLTGGWRAPTSAWSSTRGPYSVAVGEHYIAARGLNPGRCCAGLPVRGTLRHDGSKSCALPSPSGLAPPRRRWRWPGRCRMRGVATRSRGTGAGLRWRTAAGTLCASVRRLFNSPSSRPLLQHGFRPVLLAALASTSKA